MTASLIRPLMLACGWAVCCALSLVGLPSIAVAGDWPQWMGPTRDGVIHEEIIEQFPEQGLKILWRTPIAGGYAGPAVAAGKVFVPDFQASAGKAFNDPGTRAKLKGTERLLCLDATNGQVLWKDQIPCDYSISYPAGPRCTPTVDGELVYMLGAQGDLRCLKVKDGSLVWKRNLSTDLNAPVPLWGHSAHPLVDGPRLICMVGGKGKAVVALNKLTGEELWRSLDSSEAGYAPAVRHETNGQAQVVVFHPEGLAGLNPETGKPLWQLDLKPQYAMSIARPQFADNLVYASGIGTASVLFELNGTQTKERWRGEAKTSLYASNSTPVFHNGVIYGSDCQLGALMAVDVKDGSRLWQSFQATQPEGRRVSHGTAFVSRDDDRFWLFSETGDLILAKLDREGYHEFGRSRVVAPTGEAFNRSVVWSHPAYANQCAYIRNDKEIVCVSLKPEDYATK